jgi:hypothetical protein
MPESITPDEMASCPAAELTNPAPETAKSAPTADAEVVEIPPLADGDLNLLGKEASPIYLNLDGSQITDKGLTRLARNARALRQLRLAECAMITAKGLKIVASFPSLEILFVSGSQLDDEVIKMLMSHPSLRRLSVKGQLKCSGKKLGILQAQISRRKKK